jgi:hypothetical protein
LPCVPRATWHYTHKPNERMFRQGSCRFGETFRIFSAKFCCASSKNGRCKTCNRFYLESFR